MRLDIMTDIETLGTNSDSTIIQISAIAFDINTGKHILSFNQIADIELNERPIKVTGGTIKWWLKTNQDLFTSLVTSGIHSSEQVLRSFHKWLWDIQNQLGDVYLWGNGILFDNKMIQHQLESIGLNYPIYYKNDRDVRTIVELASKKMGISEGELKDKFKDESLIEHNALDDVKYQINLVVECHKVLVS